MPSLLFFGNCAELAGSNAKSASYANFRINYKVGFADYAGNCSNGAFFGTKAAAFAFVCNDRIYGKEGIRNEQNQY